MTLKANDKWNPHSIAICKTRKWKIHPLLVWLGVKNSESKLLLQGAVSMTCVPQEVTGDFLQLCESPFLYFFPWAYNISQNLRLRHVSMTFFFSDASSFFLMFSFWATHIIQILLSFTTLRHHSHKLTTKAYLPGTIRLESDAKKRYSAWKGGVFQALIVSASLCILRMGDR